MRRSTCIFLLLIVNAAVIPAQNSRAASARSYVTRGNTWLSKGELDRAIGDYELAIGSDPTFYGAFYNRGLARERKGDIAAALSDYNKTIELNPLFVNAYLNRGIALFEQGDLMAALSDFD